MEDIGKIIAKVGRNLEGIDKADHHEIATLIKTLRANQQIWAKIPSGNRNYFEMALQWYDKNPDSQAAINYMLGKDRKGGAKAHLRRAWPHIAGFVATKIAIAFRTGDTIVDSVISKKTTLEKLSGEQLMQFAQVIENNPKLSSLRAYQGSRTAVQAILRKYSRLFLEGGRSAAVPYANEKKQSLINIFKKSYLPNLIGAIARGEI